MLKDGLYYSLIPSKWLRGDWYFELAAVKNKNIRQAKCAGFEDIDVLTCEKNFLESFCVILMNLGNPAVPKQAQESRFVTDRDNGNREQAVFELHFFKNGKIAQNINHDLRCI